MRTIYKYPLQIVDKQTVLMPKGAQIIAVMVQKEQLCVWAECNPTGLVEPKTLWLIGTGNSMPTLYLFHLGSVLMGPFVWHVYEELPEEEDILPEGGDLA